MRVPGGLRLRLVLALLATSLITLVASIATLVPPLDHRLQRDRLNELRVVARTARFGIDALPSGVLRPGSREARALVVELRRRTTGRVVLLAADGTSLADTDAEDDAVSPALARIRALHLPRVADVHEGVRGGQAILVTGVQRPDGRRLILMLSEPLGDTRAAGEVVRSAVPLALAVGLAVALLLAVFLSRSLLTRLRRLREDARALGAEGLAHPVDVGPQDEVGEVAGALEAMRVRLVEEERARLAFLATASHELRTPLATLQATLELIGEDLRDPARLAADPMTLQDRADGALRQTHRMVALATDLLDLSRIDALAPLAVEPVELVETAWMVDAHLGDALVRAGRELLVDGEPPVHALGEPTSVLRILVILVDNACAYGAGSVRIAIATAAAGTEVLVRVTDEGPGLSERDRARVFARFERGDASHTRPGSGLGLPIARGLATRMGGALDAVPGDRGACFELRLPAWRPAPEDGVPAGSAAVGGSGRA